MKIITVTMVKNEENIMESFVRHAMTFSDQVVVYNHNSTDGTLQILEAMKTEFGSKLMLFPELIHTAMIINQEVFNKMIQYAFDEMDADMVIPLDADEFPLLIPKGNIRNYLETLEKDTCYQVHFMPFGIPEKWDKETFAPLQFHSRKKLSPDTDYKVLLLREPYYQYKIITGLGNHTMVSGTGEAEIPIQDLYPNLFYAHLAFRNKEHLEGKLVLRWLSLIMRSDIARTSAFQYYDGFHKILDGKELSKEERDWFCMNNMCAGIDHVESYEDIQKVVEEVDTTTLFEPIDLKYSTLVKNKSNYVLLMEFAQQVIEQFKEQKQEKEVAELRCEELQKNNVELQNNNARLQSDNVELQKTNAELHRIHTEMQAHLKKELELTVNHYHNLMAQLNCEKESLQNAYNELQKVHAEAQEHHLLEKELTANHYRNLMAELNHEKEMSQNAYGELQQIYTELEQENVKLQQMVEEKEQMIQTYANSTSWKITEPFRKVMRLLKK